MAYTDNFNRTNGDPIGGSWILAIGSMKIHDQGFLSNTAGPAVAYWDAVVPDAQYAQCGFAALWTSSGRTGVGVRIQADGSGYFARIIDNGGLLLTKFNGTSHTNLVAGVDIGTPVNSDALRIEATGSTITVKYNGTVVLTATDSTYTSGKVGIISDSNNSNVGDNFEGDALPGVLQVEAGDLEYTGYLTGPYLLTGRTTIDISNVGGAILDWTISRDNENFDASAYSGSLEPGQSDQIEITANTAVLNLLEIEGTYNTVLTFGPDTTTRTISIVLETRKSKMTVTSPTFTSAGQAGGAFAPTNQDYTVTNTGVLNLTWTATADVNWLTVAPGSGTRIPEGSVTVNVSINSNANALPSGTYIGTVSFVNTESGYGNVTRIVTLYVSVMNAATVVFGGPPLPVVFDARDTTVVQPRGITAQPTNITGVNIHYVETGHALGNATLSYNQTANTLTWGGGTPVTAVKGDIILTNAAGKTIGVNVRISLLPATNQSDTIEVISGGIYANYHRYRYSWNFGDSGSGSWAVGTSVNDCDTETGVVVAHVYRTVGEFTCTLTVIDELDNSYTYTQLIDIEDPGYTRYYFANTGNDDTNDGLSEGAPFATIAKMATLLGPNIRCSFKKGDTFTFTAAPTYSGTDGAVLIDSYGTGARPIWETASDIAGFSFPYAENVRIQGINLKCTHATPTNNGVDMGTKSIVDDCYVEGFRCSVYLGPKSVVSNTTAYRPTVLCYWCGDIQQTAILGCVADKNGDENLIRTFCDGMIVAHCEFTEHTTNWGGMRIMGSESGPGKFYNLIHNVLAGTFLLQNESASGTTLNLNQIRIEGNSFDRDTAVKVAGGNQVLIANNQHTATGNCNFIFFDAGYNNAYFKIQNILIFHNTSVATTSANDTSVRFVSVTNTDHPTWGTVDENACRIVCKNNILSAPNATSSILVRPLNLLNVNSDMLISDYNDFYNPNVNAWASDASDTYTLAQAQALGLDTHSINTNPLLTSFTIDDTSPCYEAGEDLRAYVYYDFAKNIRTSSPDIGTYEVAVTHTVTFNAGTGGTIDGASPQTVVDGADCTPVEAIPNAGYVFVNWTGTDFVSTDNPLTYSNVTADKTLTANFALAEYTVTFVEGANGTITGDLTQTVQHGEDASEVEAVPNTGYAFYSWSGDLSSTTNPLTVTNVTGNMTITANFNREHNINLATKLGGGETYYFEI